MATSVKVYGVEVDLSPLITKSMATVMAGGELDLNALLREALPLFLARLPEILAAKDRPKPTPVVPMRPASVEMPIEDADDKIADPRPASPAPFKITSVRCALSRVQFNRGRFPGTYTDENPFGLDNRLSEIVAGLEAMCYGSKFWLDLTAFYRGPSGQEEEVTRDLVLAHDLAFRTEHHAVSDGQDSSIVGIGGGEAPKAGWRQTSGGIVGQGITAWTSSLGFLHQLKAFGEGEVECWGVVGGVESNHIRFRVS